MCRPDRRQICRLILIDGERIFRRRIFPKIVLKPIDVVKKFRLALRPRPDDAQGRIHDRPGVMAVTGERASPALFMNSSAAIADSPLRQACMRVHGIPAGGLAAWSFNVPFQVRLTPSRLHAPVSPGDYAISRRPVMNNAGESKRFISSRLIVRLSVHVVSQLR